jgi:endonuclease/exonuclease/phosphatase family metal-dependent hydrolase
MPELTIATFNAHFGQGHHSRAPFDVGAVLRRLDADVVGLQETWTVDGTEGYAVEVARDLGYELHGHVLSRGAIFPRKPNTVDEGGEGDFGIALLSRLPVRRVDVITVGRAWRDRATRVGLRGVVDVGGTDLAFVSAHLSHRMWGTVPQQRRLRRALLVAEPALPTVVVGDFNLWGPPVDALMAPFRRAVRGRTWPAHRPHSQIDHVLLGPGVELVRGAVEAATPSDHRPIRAVLRVGAPADPDDDPYQSSGSATRR